MTPIEKCEYVQGRVQILTWNNITYIDDYLLELRPTWSINFGYRPFAIAQGHLASTVDLASNGETTMYVSTVDRAFITPITNHRLRTEMSSTLSYLSEAIITLEGIENAFVAMVYRMLVAYTSARFMVGEFHDEVNDSIL
ncbi:hypothetical protein FOYG_10741 [Fusarium oxysporum NRRL 32931]|uniref:Uncharacterized protein n=1 Tax=Fusarium oxysporum NRRL 32931 TaxID=660029 RepID=W9HTZ4_FUSOX|nr:hypothetical protein FOYG_10741 [Fusarium oxysporum NRRL 32931]